LFESRPNFLVSGNLYLPKKYSGPRPAHLNVIGHAQNGKANERYQRMSIAQAKNGFVVLTIDQIGQGERGVLASHRIIGTKAFLSGTHLFNLMAWDAIRAIDYLESRKEVDASKIGMTGSSGGGMTTTYILPFENRITVAIPTCNPNTWSHRTRANLSSDHEQVFFGAFGQLIDPRGDPLFCQVPNALMLNTTTDDNLNPPRGVWELDTWLNKSYAAHGIPEKFKTTMVRAGHDYNQEQRELTYSWMLKWTGGDPSEFWEEDTPIMEEEDLWAAKNGSVYNEPGSINEQDLIMEHLDQNKAKWKNIHSKQTLVELQEKLPGLIEQVLNTSFNEIEGKCEMGDPMKLEDMTLRKFTMVPESGIIIPGFILSSDENMEGKEVILYVHEEGKSKILEDMNLVEALLEKGYVLCGVDLRGIGETGPDMANKFWDFLLGKPIFGQRVKDILTLTDWLKSSEIKAQEIIYWGTGMGSLYGAFAGIMDENISYFLLEEPLISFESIVEVETPQYQHEIILPGILTYFDLPQIYQALSPRELLVLNPQLGDKSPAGNLDIKTMDQSIKPAFRVQRQGKSWRIGVFKGEERKNHILSHF
ncbi:MAG: prolyl oligopeptidase family serine peptidase, partial [Cyclobacteriaceae bacterium]